jgi:hypothetical protein
MNALTVHTCGQIVFMDIPIDGKKYSSKQVNLFGVQAGVVKQQKKAKQVKMSMDEVPAFLNEYTTAKIIVVISTHCIEESGMFVCGGEKWTCEMNEVRTMPYDCPSII